MSQEKVDYKKEQKKNVKKNVRNKKVTNILITVVLIVFGVVVVGWVSYSGYKSYQEAKKNAPKDSVAINVSMLSNFTNSLILGDEDEDASDDEADDVTTVTTYDADGNEVTTEVSGETEDADADNATTVGSLEEAAEIISGQEAE